MKNFSLLFFFVIFSFNLFSQKAYETVFSQKSPEIYEITFTVHDFALDELNISGNIFTKIDMNVSTVSETKGWAELPFINASIELPSQRCRFEYYLR